MLFRCLVAFHYWKNSNFMFELDVLQPYIHNTVKKCYLFYVNLSTDNVNDNQMDKCRLSSIQWPQIQTRFNTVYFFIIHFPSSVAYSHFDFKKDDSAQQFSYRPIPLLSIVSKVLERCISSIVIPAVPSSSWLP